MLSFWTSLRGVMCSLAVAALAVAAVPAATAAPPPKAPSGWESVDAIAPTPVAPPVGSYSVVEGGGGGGGIAGCVHAGWRHSGGTYGYGMWRHTYEFDYCYTASGQIERVWNKRHYCQADGWYRCESSGGSWRTSGCEFGCTSVTYYAYWHVDYQPPLTQIWPQRFLSQFKVTATGWGSVYGG